MISVVDSIMKHPVITTHPEESIRQAAQKMDRYKIGGLPVVEEGKVIGIITSRDIRQSNGNRLVADAMTDHPLTISKDASIWQAFQLMEDAGIEHLPVLWENTLVGIITKADLLYEKGKHIDPLTDLHNSNYVRFIGETLLREGIDIVVLFFDLDDFGQFNKKFGHIMGDKCLKTIGQILSSAIKPNQDYLGRFGGDEFIVLSIRKIEALTKWAEEAIQLIERSFQYKNLPITISVGLSGEKDSADVIWMMPQYWMI